MNNRSDELNNDPKPPPKKNPCEVSILIPSYNSIFSDFDPNGYDKRIISDDFITQIKQISPNKNESRMSLILLLPESERNETSEKVMADRLHTYFIIGYKQLQYSVTRKNKTGILLTITGSILMIIASHLSFIKSERYAMHLLLVLFEPAGWFMLWVGLDHLVYASKETKKDLAFYSIMKESAISFNGKT